MIRVVRRFSMLIWAAVIVGAAFGLYIVKYRVQGIQAEIASINKQLETERESLNVAAAEWSYLNRPERIQALAQKHLKLGAPAVQQVVDVQAVPYPHQEVAGTVQANALQTVSLPQGGE